MCLTFLKDFIFPLLALVLSIIALVFSRRTYRASKRPYLVFSEDEVTDKNGQPAIGFFLRNVGLGSAFNIEIPNKFVQQYDFLSAFSQIPRNLSPDGRTLFSINPSHTRFIKPDLLIEVVYEDYERRQYQTTLKQMKHYFKKLSKRDPQ